MTAHGGGFCRRFVPLDKDFRELLADLDENRPVAGILGRRQAQPEWRKLQGEVLQQRLRRLALGMGDLVTLVHPVYDGVITSEFPRFRFLCQPDLVAAASTPFHPEASPFASLACFEGVSGFSVEAVEPDEYDSHLQADVAVTALRGVDGTRLRLQQPVVLHKGDEFGEWHNAVVLRMQDSLRGQVTQCVERVGPRGLLALLADKSMSWVGDQTAPQAARIALWLVLSRQMDDVLGTNVGASQEETERLHSMAEEIFGESASALFGGSRPASAALMEEDAVLRPAEEMAPSLRSSEDYVAKMHALIDHLEGLCAQDRGNKLFPGLYAVSCRFLSAARRLAQFEDPAKMRKIWHGSFPFWRLPALRPLLSQ